jgi:predicted nucleic acid-binding protein
MYVEADLLYSYLKKTDWLKKEAKKIVGNFKLDTSVITVIELEIVSKRDFEDAFADSILKRLKEIENLKFYPLNMKILEKAVEYRKKHKLNIFDALHAASAFSLKKDIVSTDRIYDLLEDIKRIDPREIVR